VEVFKWIFVYGLGVHILLLVYLKKYFKFRLSFLQIKHTFKGGIPLSLYALLGAFAMIFDAWLIQYYYHDTELFAIYRYGAREIPLLAMFIFATSNSLIPEVSKNIINGVDLIRKETTKLIKFYMPIIGLTMLVSPIFFPIIFSPEFKQSSIIFNTYILMMISRIMFSHTILLGKAEHKTLLRVSFLELILNILLSIILIQFWGVLGVVYATVIAFFVEKLLYSVIVKIKYKQSFWNYTDQKWFIVFCLVSFLSYLISLSIYEKI
jgi:O-antigen/teichoic acid export membrane protein